MRTRPVTTARYAAVTSTLALLVALGGTSYAVTQVGTAQIRDKAVTAPKIARNAVDSSRVKNGSLTGADVENDALTGADIDESTLKPGTARSLHGLDVQQMYSDLAPGASAVILDLDQLEVTASCSDTGKLSLLATTTSPGSSIYTSLIGDGDPAAASPDQADLEDGEFGPAAAFDLLAGHAGNVAQITFDYFGGNHLAVSGHLVTDLVPGGTPCRANGFALVGD